MRISFAMATRNASQYLSEALASIPAALKGDERYEILVADGSSTDHTCAIAQENTYVKLISSKDSGIYDGMNRALAAARADYVMILNSDDMLLPNALHAALEQLDHAPASIGWISGGVISGTPGLQERLAAHHSPLSVEGAMFGIPAINARVFRKEALQRIGLIRTDVGLAADREWMVRIARSGFVGLNFPKPLYYYRMHEGSQTLSGDASGRLRIYQAEIQLANALLDGDIYQNDQEMRNLLSLTRASAQFRNCVFGREWPSVKQSVKMALGLIKTLAWRGKLSGY